MWFDDEDDEDYERNGTWNIIQFAFAVLCCMTLSVFVKFPINFFFGSGWALVMFIVFLVVFASPLIYVQIRLGSQFRRGLLGIFDKFFPLGLGFGIGTMIRNLISIIYISGIMTHCLSYLFFSAYPCDGRLCVGAKFIWGSCKDAWNDGNCADGQQKIHKTASAEDGFYYNYMLQRTQDISYSGNFARWFDRDGLPVIPHLLTWAFFSLTVIGGAKVFGYLLSILGGIALVMFLIVMGFVVSKGNVLNQSGTFYNRFFLNFASQIPLSTSSWDQFRFEPLVWGLLGMFVQMSMSMNIWTGVYPLMGKYIGRGRLRMNFSWIIVIVIFGALAVLPTITMVSAYASAYDLEFLRCHISQGIATPFVILTHISTQYSFHRIIPFIFFLALFIFLLLSQALLFIVVIEGIMDRLRRHSRQVAKHMRRSYLIACGIALPILYSLSFTTIIRSGYYWIHLMDFYIDRLMVLLIIGLSLGLIVAHGRSPSGGPKTGIMKVLLIVHLVIISVISVGIFVWYSVDTNQPQPTQDCDITGLSDTDEVRIPPAYKAVGWLIALAPFVVGLPIGLFSICCRREEDAEAMPDNRIQAHIRRVGVSTISGRQESIGGRQLSQRKFKKETRCWPYLIHGDYMSPTEYMEDYHPKQTTTMTSSYPSSQRPMTNNTEMWTWDSRSRFTEI